MQQPKVLPYYSSCIIHKDKLSVPLKKSKKSICTVHVVITISVVSHYLLFSPLLLLLPLSFPLFPLVSPSTLTARTHHLPHFTSTSSVSERSLQLQPEYTLPYAVYLLAHHPKLNRLDYYCLDSFKE